MECKWLSDDFSEICTNGDSPACADFCPCTEYPEICKFAEEATEPAQADADDRVRNDCVYYYQRDKRWDNIMFSSTGKKGQTIGNTGAGPVTMAMILATWVDKSITPVEIAKLAVDNGYRTMNAGTAWGFFKYVAQEYMVFNKFVQTAKMDSLKDGLREGALAICCMNMNDNCFWTHGATYVVVVGYGDEYMYAFDPCKRQHPRKQREDKFRECLKQAFIFYKQDK